MDGIAMITQRMAYIQSRINSMAPPRAVGLASSATGSTATTSAQAFSQVLASAVEQTSATSAASRAGATTATGGTLNADGVPAELAAYGNGRIPAEALQSLGVGDHRLWAPAAQAYQRMTAAAAADGVTIGITDSYRSYDGQVRLAQTKGLYSQGGLAAAPGTSEHGWGMAVDLRLDSAAQSWMRANGGRFGFVENTPREPWHWAYQGGS